MNIKRLAILVLVLALACTLIACGGTTVCESHTDEDNNGQCDVCDATLENNNENNNNENNGENNENNSDGEETYTVKIKNEVGSYVTGVEVQIFDGESLKATLLTNESGSASFKFKPDDGNTVTAKITSVPSEYVLPEESVVSFADGDFEITVTLEATVTFSPYSVTITGSDGIPVENATVQLLRGDSTFESQTTDENGVVVFQVPTGSDQLSIKVSALPDGYIYSDEYAAAFEDGQTEISIIVEKDTRVTYIVKTRTDDGATVDDVLIGFYKGDELIGTASTNKDGIATFFTEPSADITAKILSVPLNYVGHEDTITFTDSLYAETVVGISDITILPIQPFV